MRHFKSIEDIKAAEVEELAKVPGMNIEVANNIYDFFRNKKQEKLSKDSENE